MSLDLLFRTSGPPGTKFTESEIIYQRRLIISSVPLAAYYGTDWPEIMTLLAGENGYMQKEHLSSEIDEIRPLKASVI